MDSNDQQYLLSTLKSGLTGRVLSDAVARVPRHTLRTYARDNWTVIHEALSEWQNKGYLKILKDPEFAKDDEICVEFLTFFEHKSPIPGFLNWEEE